MNFRGRIFWLLIAMLFANRLLAQTTAPVADENEPGDGLRFFVITFGPGDDVWEKFGHNALRVYDPTAPTESQDLVYNWGVFQFGNVWHFAFQFMQGRLRYQMRSDPTQPVLEYYAHDLNRRIDQQELNLTPAQKLALRDLLVKTDTDANRYYLYDYYRNNCTTRVRDVIDDQIGHRLSAATVGVSSGTSLRWHTSRLDADAPWLYVALEAALGQPADVTLDRWHEMFLPLKLHDRLAETTVIINGRQVPLVLPGNQTRTLFAGTRPGEPVAPPRWRIWFFLSGMTLAFVTVGLSQFARKHWTARLGFSLIAIPWLTLMGLGGFILLWAWVGTDHWACRRNESVLQVSILALPLILLLPMRAWGSRWAAVFTLRLAMVMAAGSILGLLLKALPIFYQANWNILALCVPMNLALAYAAYKMTPAPRVSEMPNAKQAAPVVEKTIHGADAQPQ